MRFSLRGCSEAAEKWTWPWLSQSSASSCSCHATWLSLPGDAADQEQVAQAVAAVRPEVGVAGLAQATQERLQAVEVLREEDLVEALPTERLVGVDPCLVLRADRVIGHGPVVRARDLASQAHGGFSGGRRSRGRRTPESSQFSGYESAP